MKLKKLLAIILCVGMIVCGLPLTASAANVGDIIDYVLYTDITTYINGYYIPSYNINGYTAVVVEDLLYYGFDVIWDGAAKTLKVTRNYAREFCPPDTYKPTKNTHKVGDRAMPVLYTDIVTYFAGDQVTSYNVDGRTIAYVDDLALKFENRSYVWDNTTRTLKLELAAGGSASAGPLTITRQPQDVSVSSNSGTAAFNIEVSGGTAPYTYQWQVALNGSSNFVNIPNSNTFSYSYRYTNASGTSLRCVVTDYNGMVKTSNAAKILYTSAAAPLAATLSGGTAMAALGTSVPLTCTATGGTGVYAYKWYRNDVAVSSGSSVYNAQETVNGQYTYYCVVTSGTSSVISDTVTIIFATNTLELNAVVGKAFSESLTYSNLGINNLFVNIERVEDNLASYGLAMAFTTSSATISGTPTKAGVATITCRMTGYDGSTTSFTLKINITNTTLAATATTTATNVTTSTAFTISASATGGVAPYTYQWYWAGTDGVFYDMSTYATFPTNVKSMNVTADPKYSTQYLKCRVADSTGAAVYTNTLTITVTNASSSGVSKTVTFNSSNNAKVGASFSQTILFSNFGLQSSYSMIYLKSQDLNDYGISYKADSTKTNLSLSGTITKAGTATAVFELARADGTRDTLNIRVEIAAATPSTGTTKTVTYNSSNNAKVGADFDQTLVFGNFGLQSSYSTITMKSSDLASYGIYLNADAANSYLRIYGKITKSGTATATYELKRSNGTTDILNITIQIAAAAPSAKTVTRSVEFEVGTYKTVTYKFSDLGLESSYKTTQVTQLLNSAYGVGSNTIGTQVEIYGTLKSTVSQTYTAKLTRSEGTVDTLIINVNSKAAAGKNITRSFDFTVGKAESFTFYFDDNGLESSYSSAVPTKTLPSSSGITTSTYKDRVEVWSTPAVVGTHTYKASLTRTNGTVDTLTINFVVKEATGISRTVTYDSMNNAKVGADFSQTILFSNYGGLQSSYSMIYLKSSNLGDYGLSGKSSDGKTNLSFTGKITKVGTATAIYELARADGTRDTLTVVVKISN